MYMINKIVGGCLNPLVIGLVLMAAGCVCAWFRRRRIGMGLSIAAIVWLWLWSTPMMYRWIGVALEREWPVVKAEDAPTADAIVLLGGGMGSNTNVYPYAEMWNGADRVWYAARLYRASKAPIIIPTGCGEKESTVPLLLDFGVPDSAILVEDKARNTEENARFVEKILEPRNTQNTRKKILLVTSAWHMRRSVLMYRKYAPGLEIIPAATDYEATVNTGHPFCFKDVWPDAELLFRNSYIFKEYLGYWGYRLFRK
jgi:uncharacterized SAM-binding protein YcdF (DUF218 family)